MGNETTALVGVHGSLEEKTKAFQQMGAAAAMGLFPPGYDTPNKVISAAWMADALGVHPGTYMSGVSVASAQNGKVLLFPKWEFEHGLLKARLPGYKMTVIENTAKAAEIEMTDGSDTQKVRFTIEDATRMGLTSKPGWMANVVDHLFAKCFHRCADRIGAHVLGGLPALSQMDEVYEEPPKPPIEGVRVSVAERSGAVIVEDPPVDIRTTLGDELKRVYGKQDKATMLEKAAMLLHESWADELPEGAQVPQFRFKTVAEIGPVDAERILKYIAKKWPAVAESSQETQAVDVVVTPDAAAGSGPATEEAPPAETPPDAEAPAPAAMGWTEFAGIVKQARTASRTFIKEAPTGSGRWWFVDKPILDMRGAPTSVCLLRDGQLQGEALEWWADRMKETLK